MSHQSLPLLVLLELDDLLQGLFDQCPEPHDDVQGHDVHGTEAVEHVVAVQVESGVSEDDVGLQGGENQGQDDVEAESGVETRTLVANQFCETQQLQYVVDQSADAKYQDADPDGDASVALRRYRMKS